MSLDEKLEAEIAEKANKAPRVSLQQIVQTIADEYYFTAQQGAKGEQIGKPSSQVHPSLSLLTFCVLVLKNGFTVTGESACASPENFNEELGRKIARQKAMEKIWPLEGYLLRQKLATGGVL